MSKFWIRSKLQCISFQVKFQGMEDCCLYVHIKLYTMYKYYFFSRISNKICKSNNAIVIALCWYLALVCVWCLILKGIKLVTSGSWDDAYSFDSSFLLTACNYTFQHFTIRWRLKMIHAIFIGNHSVSSILGVNLSNCYKFNNVSFINKYY